MAKIKIENTSEKNVHAYSSKFVLRPGANSVEQEDWDAYKKTQLAKKLLKSGELVDVKNAEEKAKEEEQRKIAAKKKADAKEAAAKKTVADEAATKAKTEAKPETNAR